MPIAASVVVVALLSLSARTPGPLVRSITVNVIVAADVPPSLVGRVLEETSAVWRVAGIVLVWDRRAAAVVDGGAGAAPAMLAVADRSGCACVLRVTIGNEKQALVRDPTVKALGWIVFEAGAPQQKIYVSYASAIELFAQSKEVVGRIEAMTVRERETLMARAMGRALAHELGHYLLRSKAHAPKGLMRARLTTTELFASHRRGLELAADQKERIAAWMDETVPVAYATPSAAR